MFECRIVLVRPHYPGNVGATARAMHNFGLTRLLLVQPLADPRGEEARRLATHGEFILDQAEIVPTLGDAVADCVFAAATSARTSGVVRQTVTGSVREIMRQVAASLAHGPAALVFGPEPSGLTTAEIGLCHSLIHIPANPEFSALNLAQAAAICLYELHQCRHFGNEVLLDSESPAPISDLDRMYEHLRKGLEEVHFLYGPKADALMLGLRYLIGRARPTATEVRILHGLARQLEWVAAQPQAAPALDDVSPDGL